MGGGGGGTFSYRTPEQLIEQVRKAEDETNVARFESTLSELLGEVLASCNDRDAELVRDRLDQIKDDLRDIIGGSFDQFFGGSVAKHTYVDGLSDVDCLVEIAGSNLEGQSPQEVLRRMEAAIAQKLPADVALSVGRMAVTANYSDGMTLQILPAIRGEDGKLKVPSSRRDGWSTIDPISFREVLTRRNEECGGKLVPTIKLAKAIIGQLPEPHRLSGYHIESIAIAAFRGYAGPRTASAMLPVFFERAKELVKTPIVDSTGQSVHVDGYLGAAGSEHRIAASHVLERIGKRMRNATAAESSSQWRSLLGLDE